jgi:acetyltransferase
VSDKWQHKAIGHKLMSGLIDVARNKELKRMEGEVLASNENMLKLVASLGFVIASSKEDESVMQVVKVL